MGFLVKVVERSGRSLQSMFPLTKLWEGAPCGRESECITCYQGAEDIPNCTKQSVLYENICAICVPGAFKKEQVEDKDVDPGQPAIYVGETGRSILERGKEHWKSYESGKEDSHMRKHQLILHEGGTAKFVLRMVGSYRTALSRQISEAVRIRRRGELGEY